MFFTFFSFAFFSYYMSFVKVTSGSSNECVENLRQSSQMGGCHDCGLGRARKTRCAPFARHQHIDLCFDIFRIPMIASHICSLTFSCIHVLSRCDLVVYSVHLYRKESLGFLAKSTPVFPHLRPVSTLRPPLFLRRFVYRLSEPPVISSLLARVFNAVLTVDPTMQL